MAKSTKKKPAGPVYTSKEKAIAKTVGEAGYNLYAYELPRDDGKTLTYWTWAKGTMSALRNVHAFCFPKAVIKPVSAKELNAFYRAEHAARTAAQPAGNGQSSVQTATKQTA